jgi:hypothetical protein
MQTEEIDSLSAEVVPEEVLTIANSVFLEFDYLIFDPFLSLRREHFDDRETFVIAYHSRRHPSEPIMTTRTSNLSSALYIAEVWINC